MPLITTADERLARPSKSNIAIFGPSGVGKTYLARSLDPATTLVIDGEAGTQALGPWPGDVLDVRKRATELGVHPWEMARGLACLLAGPDTSDYALTSNGREPGPYSPEAHANYVKSLGQPADLFGKYRVVFMDSITVASRWSFSWCMAQPSAINDKGKADTRGVYGLHGREMVRWLTTLQHSAISMIVVGILDREEDELKRATYSPQIEGNKTARELPGIFDNVITLTRFNLNPEGNLIHEPVAGAKRGFVTGTNPWGLPGKDRSGTLAVIEEPNLGKLLAKIAGGARADAVASSDIIAPTAA